MYYDNSTNKQSYESESNISLEPTTLTTSETCTKSGETIDNSENCDSKSFNSEASVVISNDGNCINICDKKMRKEIKKYLKSEDIKETKKLLGKFINEIDESSRHHQIKLNHLSSINIEDSFNDYISVIHEYLNEVDYKLAVSFNQKLCIIDEEMNPLDDVLKISKEMDEIEHYLDVTANNIWKEFDTIDRIKTNLQKEQILRNKITELEDKSFQYRSTLKAIQFDSPKPLQFEKHEKQVYGLAEHALSVPLALVSVTTFEKILAKTRRFYESCVGLPSIDFNQIEAKIEKTKNELSIGCCNLSADQIACLSPLPTSNYCSHFSFSNTTDGISNKSFISSINALEKAISRSHSDSESDISFARSPFRCSSSASVSMSNQSMKIQSTQQCSTEIMPRISMSCPNMDIDTVLKTALEYSDVDDLVTAESPGPNTPSSTILI